MLYTTTPNNNNNRDVDPTIIHLTGKDENRRGKDDDFQFECQKSLLLVIQRISDSTKSQRKWNSMVDPIIVRSDELKTRQ